MYPLPWTLQPVQSEKQWPGVALSNKRLCNDGGITACSVQGGSLNRARL